MSRYCTQISKNHFFYKFSGNSCLQWGFPGGSRQVKNLPANAGDMRHGLDPWVGKIPWKRAWQPTPVYLPGESQGQRSLAGYSP